MREATSEFFRRMGDLHALLSLPPSIADLIAERIGAIEQERGAAAALEALDELIEMLGLLERERAASGPTH